MNNPSDILTISINSEIVATNFWDDYDSPYQEPHLSFKMDVLRVLCPRETGAEQITLMEQATRIFIIRLPHTDPQLFFLDFTDENHVSTLTIMSRNIDIEEYLPISEEGSHFGIAAYMPDHDGKPVCQFRGAAQYLLGS